MSRGGWRTLGTIVASAVVTVFAHLTPAAAQSTVHVGVGGMHAAYNEVAAVNRQAGFGAVGVARYDAGIWAVEGDLTWRSLSPSEDDAIESFTTLGGSVRARYSVWRDLDAEVGFASRSVDPEFAAQDVAVLMTGLRYESALSSLAEIYIRGAAIPLSWYNGGGDSGIGVALGLGARARPTGASWGFFAEYDFQRLDRSVQDVDVPLQMESVRVGFELGVF